MRIKTLILIIIIGIVMALAFQTPASAAITGVCSTCHTMHNSQNGTSMNLDNSATPNDILLRNDCIGCHASGGAVNIDSIGAPQVNHTDVTDLAGGNFAYITGGKARVTADQNTAGHNVIDFGAAYYETVLTQPPGAQHANVVSNTELTCAGQNGCHGKRIFQGSGITMIKGGHHNNTEGKVDNLLMDNNVGNHYRFLMGVKGFEDSDWQATINATDHNEYFGANTPMSMPGCNVTLCHQGGAPGDMRPNNQTISGFCATCHGNFHMLQGIGGNTSSPFKRHPSDVILPNSGEYSAYTAYSTEAPIARTTSTGLDAPSSTVTPGATDAVMCLSCHAVHATAYADILRWDYSDMIAGDSSKSGGCFTCHTLKNQTP
jgi:hypothetical protein